MRKSSSGPPGLMQANKRRRQQEEQQGSDKNGTRERALGTLPCLVEGTKKSLRCRKFPSMCSRAAHDIRLPSPTRLQGLPYQAGSTRLYQALPDPLRQSRLRPRLSTEWIFVNLAGNLQHAQHRCATRAFFRGNGIHNFLIRKCVF